MHGDRILAVPITTMTGVPNGTLSWPIYLPDPGSGLRWASWNGTETYAAGSALNLTFSLADVPLFVRGGIIPLKTMVSVAALFPDPLVWALFPGTPAGSYVLYEDQGDDDEYVGGEYVTTLVNSTFSAAAVTLTIAPSQSSTALPPGFPQQRAHVVQVRGVGARPIASVTCNGAAIPAAAPGIVPGYYIASEHTLAQPLGSLVVSIGSVSSWETASIVVNF
jgi:hypothetical protein